MNNKLRRELRKFLKQYKAEPISPAYQEQADRVNDLIPALVDSIKDEELDTIMLSFSDYLMQSIISPPRELDIVEEKEQNEVSLRKPAEEPDSRQSAQDGIGQEEGNNQPSVGSRDNGNA